MRIGAYRPAWTALTFDFARRGLARAGFALVALSMISLPARFAAAGVEPIYAEDRASVDLFGVGSDRDRARHTIVKHGGDRTFPYLPDEPVGRSMSIGTVTDGWIVNAVPLALPGRTYGVLPRQFQRGLLFGSQDLMAAIVAASEYVDRVHPGSILWFGNIGRRGGGDIIWSVSHNSGRDADLAFYTVDPLGRPVQPPDLLSHRDDGRSREYGGYYRFDVARNWALVKALVLSSHAELQYLFVSNGLKRLLLAHARDRGEPAAIVSRAAELMRQPGAQNPHDDHFHVRIFCSAADLGAGCIDGGSRPAGSVRPAAILAGRLARASGMLGSESAEIRKAAVERIGLIGTAADVGAVRGRLADPSPVVRAAAVEAIGALGTASNVRWLSMHWDDEPDPLVRERIIRAIGRLGGAPSGEFLGTVLVRPMEVEVMRKVSDLRVSAVDAVRIAERAEPAYALVALVEESDHELRARALEALEALANRSFGERDWRQESDAQAWRALAQTWRAWLDGAAVQPRDRWVADGFIEAGYAATGSPRAAAAELARAAGDDRRWLSVNAQRRLMQMTGHEPRSLEWSAHDARWYWTRWVRRNPSRIRRN